MSVDGIGYAPHRGHRCTDYPMIWLVLRPGLRSHIVLSDVERIIIAARETYSRAEHYK